MLVKFKSYPYHLVLQLDACPWKLAATMRLHLPSEKLDLEQFDKNACAFGKRL
jgi:hypothetical protein